MSDPRWYIRAIVQDDLPQVLQLYNQELGSLPYSTPVTSARLGQELFDLPAPQSGIERWLDQSLVGIWQAEQLIGFVHLLCGLWRSSPDLPITKPRGYLRFMVLDQALPAHPDLSAALLDWVDVYWREHKIQEIIAFDPALGYADFQGGIGLLPGTWQHLFLALTRHQYSLHDRYTLLSRPNTGFIEEKMPVAGLSFLLAHSTFELVYSVYQGANLAGRAKICPKALGGVSSNSSIAYLADYHVFPNWDTLAVDRMLLRRMINDCALLNYGDLICYLHPSQADRLDLFHSHAFVEWAYRGYVLTKKLD